MATDILKYLIIYQDSGLPIFSKCFSDFCGITVKDPALISSLLTVLEDFAKKIVGSTFQSFIMVNTVTRFGKTLPTGHSVVIGLEKDNPKVVNEIFRLVEDLLENKYEHKNWNVISSEFTSEFEKTLYNKVLCPSLQDFGGFRDSCPHGDKCPLKTSLSHKRKVWIILKERYQMIKKKKKDM